MKPVTINIPISATKDSTTGKLTLNYQEIEVSTYTEWLKKCYDLSGNS